MPMHRMSLRSWDGIHYRGRNGRLWLDHQLSKYTKKEYKKTKEQSLSTITFNPIPDTRELDVSIVKGPVTKTVTALDKRITIVCITGPINANDKSLKSLQHAKIFPNKSVELVMPDNTVCALVSDK